MSYDLYLVPSDIVRLDADLAREFIQRENALFGQAPEADGAEAAARKRELADLLLRLKPDFVEFKPNFAAIARLQQIAEDEARLRFRHVEINGEIQRANTQCVFHDRHVTILCGFGMSSETLAELDAILYSLSLAGGFVVYDPQTCTVYDLLDDTRAMD